MLQLISDDEIGTAKMFMKLAQKTTGIAISNALLASYCQYRIDFQVKGEMNEWKAKEMKKFALEVFALCQEANLKFQKTLTKTQSGNSVPNLVINKIHLCSLLPSPNLKLALQHPSSRYEVFQLDPNNRNLTETIHNMPPTNWPRVRRHCSR